MPLQQAIDAAKAQRTLNPVPWGAVTDVVLDRALTLEQVLRSVAEAAINRLTTAAKNLRPATGESAAHIAWRLKTDPIRAKIQQANAYPPPPGGADLQLALQSALRSVNEPPFDDGGAKTVSEFDAALGAVKLLLGA